MQLQCKNLDFLRRSFEESTCTWPMKIIFFSDNIRINRIGLKVELKSCDCSAKTLVFSEGHLKNAHIFGL